MLSFHKSISPGGGGGVYSTCMHGRSCMMLDYHIATMPGGWVIAGGAVEIDLDIWN